MTTFSKPALDLAKSQAMQSMKERCAQVADAYAARVDKKAGQEIAAAIRAMKD